MPDGLSTRVVLVGPGRTHQGIGPFVAEAFREAGADIVAFVGIDAGRTASAAATWNAKHAAHARASTDVAAALEETNADAVAICSPLGAHREQLRSARAACVHIFCEKPVLWPDGLDPVARNSALEELRSLILNLADAGRVLRVNTQWVYTLDDFVAVAGPTDPDRLQEFAMLLSSRSSDREMILAESLPHACALLLALGTNSKASDVFVVHERVEQRACVRLTFALEGAAGQRVQVELKICETVAAPRPLAYAVNGRRVERRVTGPEFAIELVGPLGKRRITDPLVRSVRGFLDALRAARETGTIALDPTIVPTADLSFQLAAAGVQVP